MPLDSNGIWQYTESETVAPFSEMLNRLAGSVSDAIEPLVTPGPVEWTSAGLVAGPGQSLSSAQYMVDALGRVSFKGELYGSDPVENDLLLTFPASIAPMHREPFGLFGLGSAAGVFVGSFGSTGSITELRFRYMIINSWPASATFGMSLSGLSWSKI